jgi:MarR family transcriptional regulator, organic hydroperoxide resistance regulator
MKLDNFLCLAVYSASHAFNRVYRRLLHDLGLTYPQYIVMVALWEQEEQSVGEIGSKLGLESNTLTPLLKRLEAIGFISRQRSREDERQVRIVLTSAGRNLRKKAAGVPDCVGAASGLTQEELLKLTHDMAKLSASLNDYAESGEHWEPKSS